jgi:hypothetical protein
VHITAASHKQPGMTHMMHGTHEAGKWHWQQQQGQPQPVMHAALRLPPT